MDLKLAGKVVLITGSSRGIGLATARAFAAEGCRLMLSARSAEQLAEAEAALRTSAVDVAAHTADVSKPDEAAGLVQAAVAVFGGIDVLINNVSGGGGGARIADSTDDDWRGAMERNLIQTVRMMRLALPHMKGRTGASVINVASISGWSPQLAMSGQYGAAKAALIFDTERWALFLGFGAERPDPTDPRSLGAADPPHRITTHQSGRGPSRPATAATSAVSCPQASLIDRRRNFMQLKRDKVSLQAFRDPDHWDK
jgi:NAD(P)-dependent dehydrogenase (short-subunit alcohol dehydrogenase family)